MPVGRVAEDARSPRCCSMEAGWVAVLDGDRFLGVLTPESLHAALRRSVEGAVPETAGAVRDDLGADALGGPSSSSGGTRQTDSSQSAAATRAAEQTMPIDAVTVSPPAACSRPTAGPTCTSTPVQTPGEHRAHVGAGLGQHGQAGDEHRLDRPHRTGRRRRPARPAAARALAQRGEPGPQRPRAERLGDGEHAPAGAGSHQSSVGRSPYQARTISQAATARPTRQDDEVAAADGRSMQVVPARRPPATSSGGQGGDEVGDPPVAGQHRARVERQPRHAARTPARAPAGAAGSARVVGDHRRPVVPGDGDDVDVQGARARSAPRGCGRPPARARAPGPATRRRPAAPRTTTTRSGRAAARPDPTAASRRASSGRRGRRPSGR